MLAHPDFDNLWQQSEVKLDSEVDRISSCKGRKDAVSTTEYKLQKLMAIK